MMSITMIMTRLYNLLFFLLVSLSDVIKNAKLILALHKFNFFTIKIA